MIIDRQEVWLFLQRRVTPPHVHSCPECYEDMPCAWPNCTIEDENDLGMPRGAHAVCGVCKPPTGEG
jgi:hypothetical protein